MLITRFHLLAVDSSVYHAIVRKPCVGKNDSEDVKCRINVFDASLYSFLPTFLRISQKQC